MTNLKRFLAGTLSLCMVGSMLTSCGNTSDSSSAADSKSDSSAAESTGSSDSGSDNSTGDGDNGSVSASGFSTKADRVDTSTLHGTEPSEESQNTINIYCWNTEFKSRVDKYYGDHSAFDVEYEDVKDENGNTVHQIKTIDGKAVNWVQIENEGNAYQTKLDDALSAQQTSDNKVDMFLVEADYAMKYLDSDDGIGVALSIQDLGITEEDTAEMYQYTKDVAIDTTSGELKALSWQATPGLFMYNAKIAKEVLGTDDPEEVQAAVADWDKFAETAAKMKEAGYAMVSGFDDTYRCFSNNVSSPWVDADGNLTVDPQIKAWVDQTKDFTDKGYNNQTSLWDTAWAAGQKIDGGVFGYFFSTWGIPFTLLPNTVDEAIKDDGSNAVEGNGGYGLWRACEGPQAYFWGGTWICGAIDSDNQDIVADIMKVMTCNKDVAKAITNGEQDYTNNKAAIQEIIDDGYTNPFLGGQNHLALLTEAADKIDLSNKISAYDQGCNEKFQAAMKDYFTGKTGSYEEALEAFKKSITALYGNLNCDF